MRRFRSSDPHRLRVVDWSGDPSTVCVVIPPGRPIDRTAIDDVLTDVAGTHAQHVITSALAVADARPFEAAGFEPAAHLHLLRHDLRYLDRVRGPAALRRARRGEWERIVTIDRSAFAPFWHLGDGGLRDALAATTHSRLRVAGDGSPTAFAISGRAGDRGYLQRLAVDPGHHHLGLGRALTLDALAWMRRRGVNEAFVNTQIDNAVALALYESVGFQLLSEGLVVMRREVSR